jgi:hypothetical protein
MMTTNGSVRALRSLAARLASNWHLHPRFTMYGLLMYWFQRTNLRSIVSFILTSSSLST